MLGDDMFAARIYLPSFYLSGVHQLHHKGLMQRKGRVLVTPCYHRLFLSRVARDACSCVRCRRKQYLKHIPCA